MSSNRSARQELERIFGKKCMIEALGIRYIPSKERRKIKGYTKYDDYLTYHHIKEKHDGGKSTAENGALLRGYNHRWLHSLPYHQKEQINQALQQYKLTILAKRLEANELGEINEVVEEIPLDFNPEDFVTIPAYTTEKRKKVKFNRAKTKREFRKQVEEALYEYEVEVEEQDEVDEEMRNQKFKKQIIDEIVASLQTIGGTLQSSGAPVEEQLTKVDIILDTIRFLDKYEDNVKVLNAYWSSRHLEDKFKSYKEDR